jgi:hypothetical protein
MMVLRRTYHLLTTKGHSAYFKAGVPTHVSPAIVAEAIAIGAELAPGEAPVDITPHVPAGPNSGPADAMAREQDILEAINLLVAENHRETFAASGIPKTTAIEKIVEYKVDKREVQTVWTRRAERIASGELDSLGHPVVGA